MDSDILLQLRESGELSDIRVLVDGHHLDLHRFPLMARSEYFKSHIKQTGMSGLTVMSLDDFPGGFPAMEIVADFCYGISVLERLSKTNIGHVMCAASYLQMTGPRNLVEICKSIIQDMTETGPSCCIEILVSCVEIVHIADWVRQYCIEEATRHWTESICSDLSNLLQQRRSLSAKWRVDKKELPSHWILFFLKQLIELESCPSLILQFVASFLDFIMGLFQDDMSILPSGEESMETLGQEDVNCPVSKSARCEVADHSYCQQIPVQSDRLVSGSKTAVAIFEATLDCIPDSAPMLDVVDPAWFVQLLMFASQYSSKSLDSILSMCACAKISAILSLEHVKDLNPAALILLNKLCEERGCPRVEVTDEYLMDRAASNAISLADFTQLLQSTSSFHRVSHETIYTALEKILNCLDSTEVSQSLLLVVAQHIDFSRISQSSLVRAANNRFLSKEIILKDTVTLCGKQQGQIARVTTELNDLVSKNRDLQLANENLNSEMTLWRSSNAQMSRQLQEAQIRQQETERQLEVYAHQWNSVHAAGIAAAMRGDPVYVMSIAHTGQ